MKAREAQRPASVDVGHVALREASGPSGVVLSVSERQPLTSALITPVADPSTGSTLALLLTCNSKGGHFNLADELLAECVARHVGLAWRNHIERLRLVPLPGVTLAAPDEAGESLRWQWQAFAEARLTLKAQRAQEVAALGDLQMKPIESLVAGCRRILTCRVLELRHACRLLRQARLHLAAQCSLCSPSF